MGLKSDLADGRSIGQPSRSRTSVSGLRGLTISFPENARTNSPLKEEQRRNTRPLSGENYVCEYDRVANEEYIRRLQGKKLRYSMANDVGYK